jgi:hypothetical protein
VIVNKLKLIVLLAAGMLASLTGNVAKAEAVDLTLLFELSGTNTVIGQGTLIASGINQAGSSTNSNSPIVVTEFDATINGNYINFLGHFSAITFSNGVLTGFNAQASTAPLNNPTVTIGTSDLDFTYFFNANPQINESGTIVAVSAAVPELSTWAMMVLGFVGLGFMASRRKSFAMAA